MEEGENIACECDIMFKVGLPCSHIIKVITCLAFDLRNCTLVECGYEGSKRENNRIRKFRYFLYNSLKSAFWQVPIRRQDRPKTAFAIPGLGHYEWCTTPMGLAGAPGSFSVLMDIIFNNNKNILCYVDELLVATRLVVKYVSHWQLVY